jgi:Glycosyl transferases group 1
MSIRGLQRLRLASTSSTWSALIGDMRWRRQAACPQPEINGQPTGDTVVQWPTTYQHPNAEPFALPIKAGFETVCTIRPAAIPQPYEGIILIAVDFGSGLRNVAIDYFDFAHINEHCASNVDIYIKFQFASGGYPDFPNVIAGGYVTSSSFLYQHWCRLRELRSRTPAAADVFGRFGLRYSAALRRSAIEMLTLDTRITYLGGARPTLHTAYLREMAKAKVCIDLPGQGPFCYRLVECLAMGCCIIGPRHKAQLPVPLRNGIEIIYCADDLSDLPELCWSYAQNDAKRAPIEAAAGEYFDAVLHPVRLAERYLSAVRQVS